MSADTQAYIDYYNSISSNQNLIPSIDSIEWGNEIGFEILNQTIKSIFGEYFRFLFAIIPLINLSLIYFSSKIIINTAFNESRQLFGKTNDSTAAKSRQNTILFSPFFALYVSYYGLMYSAVVLRAGIAISFLVFAYSKLSIRKYLQGIILLPVAVSFHKTAIIGILLLLVGRINFKFTKTIYYITWLILSLIYIFKAGHLLAQSVSNIILYWLTYTEFNTSTFYSNYLEKGIYFSEYSYMTLVMLINILISINYYKNIRIFKSLLNICLFGLTLQVLFGSINAFSRITDYFLFTSFLLFYLVIYSIKNKSLKYLFFTWIIITNSVFFFRLTVR